MSIKPVFDTSNFKRKGAFLRQPPFLYRDYIFFYKIWRLISGVRFFLYEDEGRLQSMKSELIELNYVQNQKNENSRVIRPVFINPQHLFHGILQAPLNKKCERKEGIKITIYN